MVLVRYPVFSKPFGKSMRMSEKTCVTGYVRCPAVKSLLFCMALFAAICIPVRNAAPADFRAGMEAFEKGNYSAAYSEFRQLDTPEAWNMLGKMYQNGQGVESDPIEATLLYRKAAQKGMAEAGYALALCYLNGDGVMRSRSEAMRLLRQAANQGNQDAVRMLARLVTERRGARQDLAELKESLEINTGPETERSLGNIAGFDLTARYGAVRLQHESSDWGVEFTTILPNMRPGGPGNRRGIDLY